MTALPKLLYRWVPRDDAHISTDILEHKSYNDADIHIDMVTYTIGAVGKTMTVEEYLSRDMGVGGNITGFFEYHYAPTTRSKAILEASPGRMSISQTHTFFGNNRDLLVVPTALFPDHIKKILTFTNGEIKDKLVSCHNMIKVGKLGSFLETLSTYGNESEWNFIPNSAFEVKGVLYRFGKYVRDMTDPTIQNFVPSDEIKWDKLESSIVNDILYDVFHMPLVRLNPIVPFNECPAQSNAAGAGAGSSAGGRRTRRTRKAKTFRRKPKSLKRNQK